MTLLQQIRIRLLIFEKALQLKRPLTEAEMLQEGAIALDQTKILFQSIGALSVAWAQVETCLDYFNGVLISCSGNPELELPRSLKPKIGFFRKPNRRNARHHRRAESHHNNDDALVAPC
jgi:hypothetical protein